MFGTFTWYNNCPKMFNKSQNGFIRKFANKRTDTANPAMKRTKIKISDGIYPIHVFILLFVCAPFVAGQNYQDCEVNGVYKACSAQPQILDFSRSQNNYSIRVDPPNYTCGTPSAPFYRLGDSIDKRQVCDASDEALKHPVEYMVDKNDASWWQSITWPLNDFDTSSRFKINITLSFNKVYQLTGDMTITFNSGRPSQMILEKSTDYGKTWTALQYYARSCETTFKDVPRVIPSTKLDEVICVSKFSGPSSSNIPGQQVKFEVYQDRLKIFTGSLGTNYTNLYNNIDGTNLVNFLTFTNLRIRLLYPATDAREFSRNFFDFLHYYYAISSISIMTECFCNLHGASCLFDDIGIKCACKHNTDGRECERCLPLYNNRPWKAGLYAPFPSGTANECQKCECNDHAESCVYNATLTKGVCQNCTNNTRGDQCELCVEGFFPNTSLPLNHTERCVECSCESLGVMNVNSSCIQEATNGKNPGQCDCKPLVTGLRCEYCQPEYYGLLIPDNNPGTCKECNCDTDGTVNNSKVCNQADGQCPCKPSTGNRRCDICKEGYFQFPKNNPSKGCLECGCDPGTSVTKSCDKTSGKCTCKDHVSGDKCSDIDKNFYVPAWDELVLQPLGAPSLDCTLDDDLWTEERPFDGNEFATCPLAKDVTLKFASVPVNRTQKDIEWPFHVGIRYSLSTPDALEGAVVVVEAEGTSGYDVSKMASQKNTSIDSACPVANGQVANITIEILPGVSTASVVINETVSLDLRCKYTLSLKFPGKINSTDNITIDSALLIPALTKMNSSVVMDSLRAYNESTNQAETLQTYNTCVGEMSGLLVRNTTMYKDNCRSLLRAVGGELNNEVTSCGCSTTGSIVGTVCDPIGGQCNCKSGVGGRKCDRCLSGYYNFTLNGCEPCNCKTGGSKHGACDRINGQCSCKANVAINGQNDTTGNTSSRYCSACLTNFYGYGTPEGCRPCDCHKDGSTAEQCADDGQCPCKTTIGGRKCDVCQPKYFQFSANGCIMCNCSSNGSTTGACNISTGVCECKENVNGDKCESCKPGYFNLRPENSKGCQPCFCFGHGSTCTSANGYTPMNLTVTGSEKFAPVNGMYTAPPSFFGDRHWSYGQMLSFVIQNSGAELSLQNTTLVTFYNKELKMTYSPKEALTVNQTAMTIVIPMFEWDWMFNDSIASAEQFYKILANVSAIHIPESINGTKLAITDLKLTTAMKVDGNGTATFVEQCTCEAASSTSGSSCERCAEGSRRPNFYNDDSFSTCTKCNCSERGATNPPQCDEWNGKCLNCRNGTMGDFCESCAENVTGTNCDTCPPNFYGLDQDGCKYCDCDKVGATGQDCNKTTGQCTCAPNVTGRRCDQCEDNYHDLKSTGCTQCSECYNLVQTEVKQLREQRDNLTKEIDRLRSNDMNSKPGVFTMKIDKTKSDIDKLTNFLTSALNSESELQSKIEAFTKHIDESATKVKKVENESQPQIETNLQQGDTMLQKALDNKHRVDVTVKDIKFLTDPVVQQAEKLDLLTESLKSAQSNFVSFTSNTTSGLSSILKTVETLENVTTEANTAANKVLADVETARTQHQNNTQQISGLVTKASQLTATSTNAMSEAKDARNTSQLVFNKTMQLKNESANVEGFNPDVASYTTRITSTKTKRDSLQSQVTTEQNSLKSRQENLTKAINESKLMLEEARSHQSEVNTLVVSVSNAERKANEAKTSEETIFKEAENMLETMKNFGDRRKVVEEKSNSSLQMVHDVEKVSQSVIMEAGNLSEALTQSQQSSATGKEAALQAYNLIKQKLDSLKPVGEKAKLVLEMAKTQLTDVESKAGVPKSTNATIIPLSTTCDGFTTQLADLQTRADKALERAQNLTTIGKTTTDRLNKLLAQIESVGEVDVTADATRLATLSTGVSAARAELTGLNLSASLASIKQALANQVTSLQNFKTKKADLEKKINYLKRLNDQVRAT